MNKNAVNQNIRFPVVATVIRLGLIIAFLAFVWSAQTRGPRPDLQETYDQIAESTKAKDLKNETE